MKPSSAPASPWAGTRRNSRRASARPFVTTSLIDLTITLPILAWSRARRSTRGCWNTTAETLISTTLGAVLLRVVEHHLRRLRGAQARRAAQSACGSVHRHSRRAAAGGQSRRSCWWTAARCCTQLPGRHHARLAPGPGGRLRRVARAGPRSERTRDPDGLVEAGSIPATGAQGPADRGDHDPLRHPDRQGRPDGGAQLDRPVDHPQPRRPERQRLEGLRQGRGKRPRSDARGDGQARRSGHLPEAPQTARRTSRRGGDVQAARAVRNRRSNGSRVAPPGRFGKAREGAARGKRRRKRSSVQVP